MDLRKYCHYCKIREATKPPFIVCEGEICRNEYLRGHLICYNNSCPIIDGVIKGTIKHIYDFPSLKKGQLYCSDGCASDSPGKCKALGCEKLRPMYDDFCSIECLHKIKI